MYLYHFFDYKENIDYESWSDLFSPAHLALMIGAFALLIALCIIFRHVSHKHVDTYLKILSILIPVLETTKIVWETYYDIKYKGYFNLDGLLPLYTCSLFIYTLPFAAWAKGKVKECALGFITTLGIFAGLTNFVYLNILGTYPLFTYASINSFYYHFLMVFTGIFLVSTGYYRPFMKDSFKAFVPTLILSILVIPVNLIMVKFTSPDGSYYSPNYMMFMNGSGIGPLETIATFFRDHNIIILYAFIIMGVYYGLTVMFIGIYNLIDFIKSKFNKKEA